VFYSYPLKDTTPVIANEKLGVTMKIVNALLSALLASVTLQAQLQVQQTLTPTEAATLEAAWAAGLRLANTDVPLMRGFNLNGVFEHISTDTAGIARTNTKQWERVEIHLPRVAASDHMVCLMVNAKCRPLPVGASIDKKNGILYWHVPNAYKGDFDLVFLQPGSGVASVRISAGSEVVTKLN
jgi:hypothetical protein